ncbi:MAG: single-stranded-DNA-specific exonuclease RecJ [Phycisphaerae bacterium]
MADYEHESGSDSPVQGFRKRWERRAGGDAAAPGASLVQRVLAARGLSDPATAEAFLSPSLGRLHAPSLMHDLDRAAARILESVKAGRRIVIYGDYDVDGITATAILHHVIKALSRDAMVESYVPHRLEEGYGLNAQAIRELASSGVDLIVTVDCGVSAKAMPAVAREFGTDLIITDHHALPARVEDLPDAYAVVHPRHPLGQYPFGDLCGAGVAYKLAWRLCTMWCGTDRITQDLRELLLDLLGPCSLGVIADVVPLLGENRIIASHGLGRVRHSRIPGLKMLVEASGLAGEKISEQDVGFKLAPRLNACGRMGHAREAVELLTVARGERAMEIARQLSTFNDERRKVERRIVEQAIELAEMKGMTGPDRRAIVLAHPEWHAGVVGIVCSRLVERFHRPTFLMAAGDGTCHGSGRSIRGFDLAGALDACRHLLIKGGGHAMAAGLELEAANLEAFSEAFTSLCNERIEPSMLTGHAAYDCEATIEDLTREAMGWLTKLGPFGRDSNPEVCLRLRGVQLSRPPMPLGKDGRHMKFDAFAFGALAKKTGLRALRVVAWDGAELIPEVPVGRPFDLLIHPSISDFSGQVEGTMVDFSR